MKKIICFVLVFIFVIFSQNANAYDNQWKIYLKEFLLQFPSLFYDTNTWYNKYGNYCENGNYPKDMTMFYTDYTDGLDNQSDNRLRSEPCVPMLYYFYDFDNDNIPEVYIHYLGIRSELISYSRIYKLYGSTYEQVGDDIIGGNRFYITPQNKILTICNGYEWLNYISYFEIKGKEFLLSDYIDDKGRNRNKENYSGYYDENSEEAKFWDDFNKFFNTLKPMPEFDYSDVINSIKYDTSINPHTGDINIIIFYIPAILAAFAITKKFNKKRII